jgi:hypothetical protein
MFLAGYDAVLVPVTTEEVAAGKEGENKFVAVLASYLFIFTFLIIFNIFCLLFIHSYLFIYLSIYFSFPLLPTCSHTVASTQEFLFVSPVANESMCWG